MEASNSASSQDEATPPLTPPAVSNAAPSPPKSHTSKRSFSANRQGSMTPPRPLNIATARPDMRDTHEVVTDENGVAHVCEHTVAPAIGHEPVYMTPRPAALGGDGVASIEVGTPWCPPGGTFDSMMESVRTLEFMDAHDPSLEAVVGTQNPEAPTTTRSSPREHMRGVKRAARPSSPSPAPATRRQRTDAGLCVAPGADAAAGSSDSKEASSASINAPINLTQSVGYPVPVATASSGTAYADKYALATVDTAAGPSRASFTYTSYEWRADARVMNWTATVGTADTTPHDAPPTAPLPAETADCTDAEPTKGEEETAASRFYGQYSTPLRNFTHPSFPNALPLPVTTPCGTPDAGSEVSDVAIRRGGPCSAGCSPFCDKGSTYDADATPLDTPLEQPNTLNPAFNASFTPPQPGELRTPTTVRLAHAPSWVRRAWRVHDMVEGDVEDRRRDRRIHDERFENLRAEAERTGEALSPNVMMEHFWRQASRAAETAFADSMYQSVTEYTRGYL